MAITTEIKKLEGENVVVEITTTTIINPITKVETVRERAVAYTEEQINDGLTNAQAVVTRWQAKKDLLV